MKFVGLSLLSVALASPLSIKIGTIHQDAAPLISSANSKTIPNSYIIKFKDHVKHEDAKAHHIWVQDLHTQREEQRFDLRKRSQIPILDEVYKGLEHTFNIAGEFLGYSGHFDDAVIEQLRWHPDVEYIEQDSEVHALESTIEKLAPWGLARISHRDQLSLGSFNKYSYSDNGGEGVDVYVIDTGTHIDHVDFEGRASWGKTFVTEEDFDGNGHGTHCSGTIAGKKYGVAKKANVIAIKVLKGNGSGTMSGVVKGVEFAAISHAKAVADAKAGKRKGFKGSAANMSLGGGKSPTLDLAVNAAVEAGIHFAVAAGNDNADACSYSPASAEKAVTVGASTSFDKRAYFSNFGKCTDIFAPGLNIQSTWIGSKYATNTISGTSMASPHIAGLLAYLLSLQPAKDSAFAVADISPKKLKDALIAISTRDALTDIPEDTPNFLAWNGGGSGNFTDIVKHGGYQTKKAKHTEDEQVFEIPNVEEIRIVIESAKEDLKSGVMVEKMKQFTEDMEKFVEKEMKKLF